MLLAGLFGLIEQLDEETARAGGFALSLFTLLLGLFLMMLERQGALRSAGVTLAAGAAAPLVFLLVNDPREVDGRGDVLLAGLLAVVAWLLLFVLSPARGHSLFLGLALVGLWLSAVSQTAPETLFFPFRAGSVTELRTGPEDLTPPPITIPKRPSIPTFTVPTFRIPKPVPVPAPEYLEESLGSASLVSTAQPFDDGPDEPPIAPSVVSILFGVLYLLGAVVLDRMRLARLGSAFVAVGTPVLAFGVVFVGPRHGGVAVGVGAVALGLFLLAVGIGSGRRFSAWAGAGVLAGGVMAAIADAFDGPGAGDAVAMLVIGAALVAAGRLASDLSSDSEEPPAVL